MLAAIEYKIALHLSSIGINFKKISLKNLLAWLLREGQYLCLTAKQLFSCWKIKTQPLLGVVAYTSNTSTQE